MNVSVLSNVNMDSLKSHLKKVGVEHPYFCGYNQYLIELLDRNSFIHKNVQEYIFIHLDGEELLKNQYFSIPRKEDLLSDLEELLSSLRTYIHQFPHASIILSTIVFPPFSFISYLDTNSPISYSQIEHELNAKLDSFSIEQTNVIRLDFNRLVKLYGYNALVDDKYWYLGRIKYTNLAFSLIAEELKNLIHAFEGKTKKVLVLDLDNTLWGGILGEDGLNGINLSEEGVGKIYRDFQKIIHSLKGIGILLVINSKNNESDVCEAFDKIALMVLKYDDFIVKKINWQNKVQNMKEIAGELNLGLSSFVFIDDSPVERALVKESLQEVEVPEFPSDITMLKKWFLSEVVYKYFGKVRLTTEDLNKTEQYVRNTQRNDLANSTLEISEFLKTLKIELIVSENDLNIKARLAQLSQKTNQFNLTTRRYQEVDLELFMECGTCVVYGLEYADKFGNEGIVGAAIIKCTQQVAFIDTFLLSCRVLGRNVEFSFLYKIIQDLNSKGITKILGEYLATDKNQVVKNFYADCGLTEMESGKMGNGKYEGEIDLVLNRLSVKCRG